MILALIAEARCRLPEGWLASKFAKHSQSHSLAPPNSLSILSNNFDATKEKVLEITVFLTIVPLSVEAAQPVEHVGVDAYRDFLTVSVKGVSMRFHLNLVRPVCTGLLLIAGVTLATPTIASAATPNAPTGVGVAFSTAGAKVSWTAPTPVSGVTITGYTATATPAGQTCTLPASAPTLACTIPQYSPGTSVTFSVFASSSGGDGPTGSYTVTTTPSPSSSSTTLGAFPASPQNVGTAITFVADVPIGATGTVDFLLGGATISGCGSQYVSSGYALCTTSALVMGSNSVTAVYSGDTNYSSSTSSALSFPISSTSLVSQATPLVVSTTFGPGNAALTLTTTGGSGSGSVTYTASNGTATGCSVSGALLTFTSVSTSGTCLVVAQKASDGTYLPEVSNVTSVTFFGSYAAIYGITSETPIYSYSCPEGGVLSGTTCGAQSIGATPNYSCSSGWSGPIVYEGYEACYRLTHTSTQLSCTNNGGVWLGGTGNNCELYTTANISSHSCPSGWTLYSTVCQYPAYAATATITGYNYTYGYTCPVGGSDSVYTCTISGGDGPNLRHAAKSSLESVADPTGQTSGVQRSSRLS